MNKENIAKIKSLAHLMLDSQKTMVLTGAGISTASGIPDFRSRRTGLWEKTDPMKYLTRQVLMEEPAKFYDHIYNRPKPLESERPKPNRGHIILSELEEKGLIDGIITQNVDRLHQDAGSQKVYAVHGNVRDGHCTVCDRYISTAEIRSKVESGEIPPRCNYCGGVARSSVVLFGDKLPETYNIAREEIKKSDLLVVIGSSLAVSPVNFMVLRADKMVIINKEIPKLAKSAEFVIQGDATLILEELMSVLDL